MTTAKLSPGIYCIVFLMTAILLSGCSDMQFAGKRDLIPEKDPREDIVLTNVATQMTSGGLVNQRVEGKQAVFSNNSSDLTIKDVQVTTLGDNNETQSITRAEFGQIYFSDRPHKDPAKAIGRKDMKFAGNVLYRNPQKNDPTTDSLRMTSDLVLWNQKRGVFISPEGYEMLLMPKGQKPVRQRGKGFEAAQDLTRFVVKAGSVTTDLDNNSTQSRAEMLAQFAAWNDAAQREADRPLNVPTTVSLDMR